MTLFKSIRKASKVISRDRVGYNCSQQTKRCFDNQFYKKIELLCFEGGNKGGNKGGGNYTMILASLPVRTGAYTDE